MSVQKKFLFVATNFLALLNPVASHGNEPEKQYNCESLTDQAKALLYFTCANADLLTGNYEEAFAEYEKTLSLIDDSEECEGITFISLFSLVSISDKLFMSNEREFYLDRLRKFTEASYSQYDSSEDTVLSSELDCRAKKDLMSIALMANSEEVRTILISYILEKKIRKIES